MNDDLKYKLKKWKTEYPDSDLARRITAHAFQHKQIVPFGIRLSCIMESAFSVWTYGLSYKMASIAVIASIGLTIGIASSQPKSTNIDIVSLAFGAQDIEGMEES